MRTFSWCRENNHGECRREYNKFYIDPKTNRPVYTGEVAKCECPKRGCKCYVPATKRTKAVKRKK